MTGVEGEKQGRMPHRRQPSAHFGLHHYSRIYLRIQWKKLQNAHYEQGVNFTERAGYTVEKNAVVVYNKLI